METYLKRQKFVVHGFEARALKHIPKIVYVLCERILRQRNIIILFILIGFKMTQEC